MPTTPTRRLGLIAPTGGDPADVPTAIGTVTDQLEASVLGYGQGTLAGRPVAGTEGRLYYSTDERTLYYDFGGGWVPFAWQPGDMRLSAKSGSAPDGWLTCNGAPILRTRYAALFTAISTIYGAGDRSTTFNVPSAGDNLLMGAGALTTVGRTLEVELGADLPVTAVAFSVWIKV